MLPNKFFAIDFERPTIKAGNLSHKCTLNENQPTTKNITLINIMLSKPTTAINNMCFP